MSDQRVTDTLVSAVQDGSWRIDHSLSDFGVLGDTFTECVAFTQGLGHDASLENGLQYTPSPIRTSR